MKQEYSIWKTLNAISSQRVERVLDPGGIRVISGAGDCFFLNRQLALPDHRRQITCSGVFLGEQVDSDLVGTSSNGRGQVPPTHGISRGEAVAEDLIAGLDDLQI